MELHYSQTVSEIEVGFKSFTTLWNYTILKHFYLFVCYGLSFTTLWNYTILKLGLQLLYRRFCFTTLWNYTILKPPL